jgi:hypothetical protein
MTLELLTLEEAANRLRRTPRQLREFLRAHPLGLDGHPLYSQVGRDKLFRQEDLERILAVFRDLTEQGLPCRSSSGRRVPAKRRITRSEALTSESVVRRALALAGAKSPNNSSARNEQKLNVVPLPGRENRPSQKQPSIT